MLHLIDDALEQYLRESVPLPASEVDIAFNRPDKEWSASVTRPTVNIFMWDLRRNVGEQEGGMETVVSNGKTIRRPPLPRVDCRYLMTVWAGDPRDEHQLLGAVLGSMLKLTEISPQYLGNGYSEVLPLPTVNIARFDGSDSVDFWTALAGEIRPGLDITVTATVDSSIITEAGPPVQKVELRSQRVVAQITELPMTGRDN